MLTHRPAVARQEPCPAAVGAEGHSQAQAPHVTSSGEGSAAQVSPEQLRAGCAPSPRIGPGAAVDGPDFGAYVRNDERRSTFVFRQNPLRGVNMPINPVRRRSIGAALSSAFLVFSLFSASAEASSAACRSGIEQLPGAGFAVDINNFDTVVGNDTTNVLLWRSGRRQVIVRGAVATAINDQDVVVGRKVMADGSTRAFRWSAGRLSLLQGEAGWAAGISDSGWIVGAVTVDSVLQPALWRNGRLDVLPLPEGSTTGFATGVNNLGQIIGVSGGTDSRAWRWWNGHVQSLDSRYGVSPLTIGGRGRIAGHITINDGTAGAPVVWSSVSAPVQVLGSVEGWLSATDGAGRFVGSAFTGQHGDEVRYLVAIVWNPYFGVRALRSLSGTFNGSSAGGANLAGSVVGWSTGPTGGVPTLWRCAWKQAEALPR